MTWFPWLPISSSRFWRQTLQIQSHKKRSSGCSLLSVWTVHSSKNYSYPHKKTKQRKTPHVDPLHQVCQDILGHEVHSAHARHYSVHRMVTGDNSNRVSDAGCFVSQWKWMNCLQIQVITNIWKEWRYSVTGRINMSTQKRSSQIFSLSKPQNTRNKGK